MHQSGLLTLTCQTLSSISPLCPTGLIYTLVCLPCFHISPLAETKRCKNSQPACLQYCWPSAMTVNWQSAHMVLIQTPINISAKVFLLSWTQHNKLAVYCMFHEGHGPQVLSWQQKRSQCKEALGWMSDLYGCPFAVTTKKTWLSGLSRTGGFVWALSVSVTRSLTLSGHTANEVGGQRAPGSPFLIYSDEEDLKRRESQSQDISGRFLPWTTKGYPCGSRVSGLNHSVIYGNKIPTLGVLLNKENTKIGRKSMTHTLMYVFWPLFKHGKGEWGLWKLWGAATDVSPIIDCEIWHRNSSHI